MLKKTMALVLTLVMTAALAVPMVALASGSSADYGSSDYSSASSAISSGQRGGYELTYETKTDVPRLDLTITGGGGLVMNPYGIARTTSDSFGVTSNNKSQIISTKLTITSKTELPVKVGATVQAVVTPADTAKKINLVSTFKDTSTTKDVSLYLAAAKDDTGLNGTFTTYPTKDANGDATAAGILLIKSAYDATKKTGAVTNASLYTIPAYTSGNGQPCILQFFGKMIAEPKDDPWQPNDKIQPTVILDFQLQKVPTA